MWIDLFTYVIIGVIAYAGYRLRALTISGAAAAFITGVAISIGAGIQGLFILALFFGTSTLWSKYKKQQKKAVEEKLEKSDARDWVQVCANGGIGALFALVYRFTGHSLYEWMMIVSFAAANSDTWASEIGSLSKSRPFHLLRLRVVDRGTSGAISVLGTFAAVGGSVVIACGAFYAFPSVTWRVALFIALFGFIGNVIDSVLGATVQVSYRCQVCGMETERKEHCGSKTVYARGISFLNNDAVNALSILFGTLIGGLFL
ncbi:DUF92 domain-containing protein [Priestia koreensis]|uniref:DUF92 domain-containing protein n=1 Tax=Priestia koreensis TaxID=284581 RepID=UPI003D04D54A